MRYYSCIIVENSFNNFFFTMITSMIMQKLFSSFQYSVRYSSATKIRSHLSTVEPRNPDSLRTRKMCRYKRSVAVTGVGETFVYKKLYFFMDLRQF